MISSEQEQVKLENLKTLQEFVLSDIYTLKKLIVLCLKTRKTGETATKV